MARIRTIKPAICARCGIDTTLAVLCLDCADVEAEARAS